MAGTGREDDHSQAGTGGDAWSWGTEMSRAMAERLLGMYRDMGSMAADKDLDGQIRRIRADLDRWVDLSVEVFDRAFSVVRHLAGSDGHHPPETRARGVSIFGAPGRTLSGEVWSHNVSAEDRPVPELACTGLVSAEGSEISRDRIRFESDGDGVEASSSRRAFVVVDVPATAPAGTYHGQIVAASAPDSAIALAVHVTAARDPGAD